jgi:uncharacterized membrane protein YkoI
MFNRNSIVACSIALVLAYGSTVRADEDADRLAKAPAPVRATAKKVMGKYKLEGFDKETEEGKTVYELNYSVNGGDYAAVIGEDGAILEQEVEVDPSVVPDSITEAAKKAQPTGKIAETAIVNAGGKLFYEFESKVGKDTHEIKISADGSVIADTVAAPEADAADKEKESDKEKAEKKD